MANRQWQKILRSKRHVEPNVQRVHERYGNGLVDMGPALSSNGRLMGRSFGAGGQVAAFRPVIGARSQVVMSASELSQNFKSLESATSQRAHRSWGASESV